MTTIRTTCVDCGTVELAISQVTLEPGRYRFDCPLCETTRLHPASARTVSTVSYTHLTLPTTPYV